MTGDGIEVSNPDRVVYPDAGVTKGEVVAYYRAVGDALLPYLDGRALTVERYPKGLAGGGFMQKNAPDHYPDYIDRFTTPKEDGGVTVYPVISTVEAIVYLANQGVITFHVPPVRVDRIDRPDWVIWDLDPSDSGVEKVRRAAHTLHEVLDAFGIPVAVMTSGSRGYHLRSRLVRRHDSEAVATMARGVAVLAAEAHPNLFTVEFMKKNRGDRVFIDWLRNAPFSTAVAPWSLRGRANAPVAAPIDWADVEVEAPGAIDLREAIERAGSDPWSGLEALNAGPAIKKVAETLDAAGLDLPPFDRFRG